MALVPTETAKVDPAPSPVLLDVPRVERRIPPSEYHDLFLSDHLEGYEDFLRGSLSGMKAKQLDLLDVHPGHRVLEIGFGRGEFLRHCSLKGASVAGVDYCDTAVEIARQHLQDRPNVDLRASVATELPFLENQFDRTFSSDVIEHLNRADGLMMLREIYRVTRPGGFMLVKTTPNTHFVRRVYPVAKLVLRWIDPEGVRRIDDQLDIMRRLHVFEYNYWSYRKVALDAGLPHPRVWVDADITRSHQHRYSEAFQRSLLVRAAAWAGGLPLVRNFLGNDLYMRVDKPAG